MTNETPSAFAATLKEMLNHPKAFSRQEWATILGITMSAISQWLGDETVPKASTLRAIVDVVERHCGAGALNRFYSIADQPAELISPHGTRMGPSISLYLVRPIREGFLRVLDTLDAARQERVLSEASEILQTIRTQPASNWDMKRRPGIAIDTPIACDVEPSETSQPIAHSILRRNQASAVRPAGRSDRWTMEPV